MLFGELIIFSFATVGLAAEYQRGTLKEISKERHLQNQIANLEVWN